MADLGPAAFRRDPFPVQVGDDTYTFPALSAARWLDILSSDRWMVTVLRQLEIEEYERFLDRPELTPQDVRKFACAALAGAGGRPWYQVLRLAATVLDSADALGAVLLRGIDPERMTLAAFTSCVWVLMTQSGDQMQRMQTEMQLTMPPPEILPEEIEEQEMTMEEMVAAARSVPGMRIG